MAKKVKVSGMSCQHCVNHVTKALEGVEGVKNVKVDLKTSEATFESSKSVSMEEITNAIHDAGYGVG